MSTRAAFSRVAMRFGRNVPSERSGTHPWLIDQTIWDRAQNDDDTSGMEVVAALAGGWAIARKR